MSRPDDPPHTDTRGMPSAHTEIHLPAGPSPPEQLGGYRLVAPIGRGGMGVVYRAEDPRVGRQVAVKVMSAEAAARPGFRDRFLREARAQGRVEHDNVVPIYAADEEQGVAYLVMPLLRGQTLAARLKRGPLPLADAVRVARETAEGVAAAHKAGLIHQDIKPANIWLDDSGRARLMDFGLACEATHGGEPAAAGSVLGTPQYMAPEQCEGRPVDDRADLFSLGCVLYEMLTGRRPFRGIDLATVLDEVRTAEPPEVRGVPPALAALIRSLLAKDPAARPSGARAVADALRRIEEQLVRWPRALIAALAAAACLVAVGAWLLWPPQPKPKAPVERPPAKGFPSLDPGWVTKLVGLPRKKQIEELREELKRRNPGFDGTIRHDYWDQTEKHIKLIIPPFHLKDLTPVRAITGLRALECPGEWGRRGQLESLEPIRGLELNQVGFSNNPVRDLSPLEGMPIRNLWLSEIEADDVSPVYGMPLEILHLTSRSPQARVEVGKLVEKKLRDAWINPKQANDFERLKEIPTLRELNGKPAARFWHEYEKGDR
jgi:serine/threonine protein kinase